MSRPELFPVCPGALALTLTHAAAHRNARRCWRRGIFTLLMQKALNLFIFLMYRNISRSQIQFVAAVSIPPPVC